MGLIVIGILLIVVAVSVIFAHRDYWVGYQLGKESVQTKVFYNIEKDGLLVKKEHLFPRLFWKGYRNGSGSGS